MVFLAMQYGEFVEVLEPENIRDRIKENISEMAKKYMVYKEEMHYYGKKYNRTVGKTF